MFSDAFKKIKDGPAAKILDHLNPLLDGGKFDAHRIHMIGHSLDFYEGWDLIEVNDFDYNPARKISFIYNENNKENSIFILDGTNNSINKLNKINGLSLIRDNVKFYLRFYLSYVYGQHGAYQLIENLDSIDWLDEPTIAAKKSINSMLEPIYIERKVGGGFDIKATIMFKNSLFKAMIDVTENGLVTIKDQELLIENISIMDQILAQ